MTIARRARTPSFCRFGILLAVLSLVLLPAAPGQAQPAGYQQTNLVSDQPGVAEIQDPTLVSAWGIALSPTGGAFFVSANATGVSDLYTGDVNGSPIVKAGLTVAIPGGMPTGLVFNPNPNPTDFVISNGVQSARAIFIFATAAGTIAGWNPAVPPATTARTAVSTPGAVYTGLAIGTNSTGNFLYAADYENGRIDVFDRVFQPTELAGSFTDPGIPGKYRPFNIQNLAGKLYVTYARRDKDGDGLPDGGAGGFVSVFDTDGNFLQRLISHDHLRAPWGLAIAPADFGPFSSALLVGNFGNGRIGAYDLETGALLGQLRDATGKVIEIDGLFGLAFGNGVSAGDRNALYFAAGPRDGLGGLFGSLRVVVLP